MDNILIINVVDLLIQKCETFEKCSFLFEFKSKIPDFEREKAKILTIPVKNQSGQASIH
jgi:hypothetical protein